MRYQFYSVQLYHPSVPLQKSHSHIIIRVPFADHLGNIKIPDSIEWPSGEWYRPGTDSYPDMHSTVRITFIAR